MTSLASSLATQLNVAAASLFATFFPSDCRICNAPLLNISRLPVCEDCLSAMQPISGALCSVCGERLAGLFAVSSEPGEVRCELCRRAGPPYIRAIAYGSYDGGLRELIHLLKYDKVRPAANVLGRMLAEVIAELEPAFGSTEILVVPVPLHASKKRERGFNQSDLMARAAVKQSSLGGRLKLQSELLQRKRITKSQIGLTRHQRRENLRGAFTVTDPSEVAGRIVLLIDDVFTTGTTVSECARILRRAGASKVFVATAARTLKNDAAHVESSLEVETRMAMAATG
ncbi:MAG TPA: ComF family protein [Terriglobales bacterium]|nr:ComF family protein [Terriglobales bacterium]